MENLSLIGGLEIQGMRVLQTSCNITALWRHYYGTVIGVGEMKNAAINANVPKSYGLIKRNKAGWRYQSYHSVLITCNIADNFQHSVMHFSQHRWTRAGRWRPLLIVCLPFYFSYYQDTMLKGKDQRLEEQIVMGFLIPHVLSFVDLQGNLDGM